MKDKELRKALKEHGILGESVNIFRDEKKLEAGRRILELESKIKAVEDSGLIYRTGWTYPIWMHRDVPLIEKSVIELEAKFNLLLNYLNLEYKEKDETLPKYVKKNAKKSTRKAKAASK